MASVTRPVILAINIIMASICKINSAQDKFKNTVVNTSKDKDISLQRMLKYVTRFCDLTNSKTLSVLRIMFRMTETMFSDTKVSTIKSAIVIITIMLETISITAFCIHSIFMTAEI
jgi:hypothetical protein